MNSYTHINVKKLLVTIKFNIYQSKLKSVMNTKCIIQYRYDSNITLKCIIQLRTFGVNTCM